MILIASHMLPFFHGSNDRCLALMRNETVIPFSERDLSSACVAVAEWLEVAAADNVEQRLRALFLAVRLAQHLGPDWAFVLFFFTSSKSSA